MDPDEFITWKTHEYEYSQKTADWYWVLGIGVVTVMVISVLLKDVLFAVLVLAGAFAFAVYSLRKSPEHTCTLTDAGLLIDEHFYPFENIISFSIVEYIDPNKPARLTLHTRSILTPELVIPLPGVDLLRMYQALLEELEEHEHRPSVIERLMQIIRF